MVKREMFVTRIMRDGDFTRMDFTMVGGPRYPRAVGTSNLPFEKIKHLMSSRPYDLQDPRASGRGRARKKRSR
jgi:hypothetical protein